VSDDRPLTMTPTHGLSAGIPPAPVDSVDVSSTALVLPSPSNLGQRIREDDDRPLPKRWNRANKMGGRRIKPPKDSKVYKAAIATIALRAQGCSYKEIAEHLSLSENTIKVYLKRAHARGWINLRSFDDPDDRLEHVIKDKVTRNLDALIDETTDEGVMTDRAADVTLKVAAGTGLLKTHQVVKGEGQGPVGVALKIDVVMPPNVSTSPARDSAIGGTPVIDAPVIVKE
jgi:predicted transcriptional regulator